MPNSFGLSNCAEKEQFLDELPDKRLDELQSGRSTAVPVAVGQGAQCVHLIEQQTKIWFDRQQQSVA